MNLLQSREATVRYRERTIARDTSGKIGLSLTLLAVVVMLYPISATSALLLGLVLAGAFPLWLNRQTIGLHPDLMLFVALVFSLTVTGRAVLFIWQPFEDELYAGYVLGDLREAIDLAMAVALLGFLSLLVGYYASFGKTVARCLPLLRTERALPSIRSVLIIYVLAMAANYVVIKDPSLAILGRAEPFANFPFQVCINLMPACVFFVWAHVFRRGRSTTYLAGLLLTLSIVLLLLARGGKGATLYTLIGAALARRHFRGALGMRSIVVLAVISIGVVTPLDTIIRTTPRFREEPSPVRRIANGVGALSQVSWPEFQSLSVERVVGRLQSFNSIMAITQAYPPYLNGEGLIRQIREGIGFRFLGTTERSDWYGDMSVFLGSTPLNQDAVTPIGDLYRNFGPVGVVPGMILLGIALRCLAIWFRRMTEAGSSAGWLFYLTTLNVLVSGEGTYTSVFFTTLRVVVVLTIGMLVVRLGMLVVRLFSLPRPMFLPVRS